MTSLSRFRSLPLVVSLGLLCVSSGSGATGKNPKNDEDTSINVVEFETIVRNTKGVVRCGIFREAGWLKDPVKPARATINGKTALCVFKGIPKGVYGMSAFHDENNNGKLDTNFVGMPTEDYCASRGARNTFGPPSFEDAKFRFEGGTKRLKAWMK